MYKSDCIVRTTLLAIAVLLGLLVLRAYLTPEIGVLADSSRVDHLNIVSSMFVYQGKQGLLVLDKRNGNVWFIIKSNIAGSISFGEPQFVIRVPLEKLDEAPR